MRNNVDICKRDSARIFDDIDSRIARNYVNFYENEIDIAQAISSKGKPDARAKLKYDELAKSIGLLA